MFSNEHFLSEGPFLCLYIDQWKAWLIVQWGGNFLSDLLFKTRLEVLGMVMQGLLVIVAYCMFFKNRLRYFLPCELFCFPRVFFYLFPLFQWKAMIKVRVFKQQPSPPLPHGVRCHGRGCRPKEHDESFPALSPHFYEAAWTTAHSVTQVTAHTFHILVLIDVHQWSKIHYYWKKAFSPP